MPSPDQPRRGLLLIACWLVVLLPAAWGITQTVKRSLDLFTTPTPSAKQ